MKQNMKNFNVAKHLWFVKEKFFPGHKITERIHMLLRASGLAIIKEDVDLDVHQVVKTWPYLGRPKLNWTTEGVLPTIMYFEMCAKDYRSEYSCGRARIITKRQLETALIKYIKAKVDGSK